jgi:hypothetical protein
MTHEQIKAKIAGREMAAELCEYIGQPWEDGTGADFAESLLRELAERLPKRAKQIEPEEKPLPIARLGATIQNYGQYSGKCYDDIPLSYLDWLCRENERQYKELKAYLTHPELESRRGSD